MSPLGTFLNGGTVTQLHGVAFLALSEVGSVGRSTVVSDGAGGGTVTWHFSGTIPCRIDEIGDNENLIAERISERASHTLALPGFTQISVTNRFAIQTRGTFEVLAVHEKTAEQIREVEVVSIT